MCFVSNHFAAHLEAVSRRNADFDHIYRTMAFNKPHGSTGSSFTFLKCIFAMFYAFLLFHLTLCVVIA
jgi:hypothetical protein